MCIPKSKEARPWLGEPLKAIFLEGTTAGLLPLMRRNVRAAPAVRKGRCNGRTP